MKKDFLSYLIIICVSILFVSFSGIGSVHAGELEGEAETYREKGYKAQEAGDMDAAISWYQKASSLDQNYAAPHNDLGILFEAKGWSDRAEAEYQKALAIDPDYVNAHTNLALLYERKGELEKAAFHWMRRYRLGKSGDPWTMEAKHRLEKIGLLDKAKRRKARDRKAKAGKSRRRIKKPRPRQEDPQGWQRIGTRSERKGTHPAEKKTRKKRVRGTKPGSGDELQASLRLAERRLREQKSRKRGAATEPGKRRQLSAEARNEYLKAEGYYKRGEYSRALDVIRGAKKKFSREDFTLTQLEQTIKNKIKEERIEDHYNEGIMRYRQKNFAGARKEFEAMLNILPE